MPTPYKRRPKGGRLYDGGAAPLGPTVAVDVGTFTKSTAGAPAVQTIPHGLGVVPKALILWTLGGTADGVIKTQANGDGRGSFGYASGLGASNQYVSAVVADSAAGALHGRMISRNGVVLLIGPGAGFAVLALAALTSVDASNFTITWTTNNAEAQLVHYMVIGGSGVLARVADVPISPTGPGRVITGVGFSPNLIIGSASCTTGGFDVGQTSYALKFGASSPRFMLGDDGEQQTSPALGYEQWTGSAIATQANGQATRVLRDDRILVGVTVGGTVLSVDATLDAMGSDGFTETVAGSGGFNRGVLYLKVPGVAAGVLQKPTAAEPVDQSVSSLGFIPRGVLFATVQKDNGSVPTTDGAAVGISAFAAGGAAAAASYLPTSPGATAFNYLSKTGKAVVKVNNNTPAVDAEATGTLDADGFTLSWSANDAVATEFGYIVIGELAPASPHDGHLISFELNGPGAGWTYVSDDVLITPAFKISYGIQGTGPGDLVAPMGSFSWALNNSDENSAGLLGYYTLGGPNVRLGFVRGMGVRYRYRVPGTGRTYLKFSGRLINAEATPGEWGDRRVLCDAGDWMLEAGAAPLSLPTQINKRSDELVAMIVTQVARQPTTTSYAPGNSTFPYSFDNSRSEASSALTEITHVCQSEYCRCYMRGGLGLAGMELRLENRTYRLTPLPVATFTGTQQGLKTSQQPRNRAKVTVHPRRVGATATDVLFAKPDQSAPAVQPGATITLTLRYTDPAQLAARVGGVEMVPLVATTDYLANAAADGTGANLTANMKLEPSALFPGPGLDANQAVLRITNTGGTLFYVTKLQGRGRVLRDFDPQTSDQQNAASIAEAGESPFTLNMPFQSDFIIGDAVAEFVVDTWSTPGVSEISLRFIPADADELELAMSLEPGDPIAVVESVTATNGIFYIQGVDVSADGDSILFEWSLQRALVQAYWTLGVAGFSELGINTVLAPL